MRVLLPFGYICPSQCHRLNSSAEHIQDKTNDLIKHNYYKVLC